MWGQAPSVGSERKTFSTFLARYGVGGGASLRRCMPKGALMSGFENRPRGRRLCPRRRAVDCAAVGNVKMWNCGNVRLGLRQIPPRGARGRGAESAALGQRASCPLGGEGLLGQRASCPLEKRSFSLQFQRAGRPLSQSAHLHFYAAIPRAFPPFHHSTFPPFHFSTRNATGETPVVPVVGT